MESNKNFILTAHDVSGLIMLNCALDLVVDSTDSKKIKRIMGEEGFEELKYCSCVLSDILGNLNEV